MLLKWNRSKYALTKLSMQNNIALSTKASSHEQSWREVAYALNCTPEESKKRWRSLRDAFMKQIKQNANDDLHGNPKKKKWRFYDLMEFLGPYLDASAADDSYKMEVQYVEEYEQTDETNCYKEGDCRVQTYIKSKVKPTAETVNEDSTSDEIIEHDAEEQEPYELYERSGSGEVFAGPIVINPSEAEHDNANNSQIQIVYCNEKETTTKPPTPRKVDVAQVKNTITDPDERFLRSCAPILKRLSQKKNSLARLKVQELLYEIEFGDT